MGTGERYTAPDDENGKDGNNKMINLSTDQLDEESIGKAKKVLDRIAIEHMIP